ncbi:hypothetical protein B0H10DRAFT_1947680 [Mycena sp. CBHHK59/15]|nr:hypothetical protein B0H10DRAFT_1947680 [Mycena sp. CBHHK59/15]
MPRHMSWQVSMLSHEPAPTALAPSVPVDVRSLDTDKDLDVKSDAPDDTSDDNADGMDLDSKSEVDIESAGSHEHPKPDFMDVDEDFGSDDGEVWGGIICNVDDNKDSPASVVDDVKDSDEESPASVVDDVEDEDGIEAQHVRGFWKLLEHSPDDKKGFVKVIILDKTQGDGQKYYMAEDTDIIAHERGPPECERVWVDSSDVLKELEDGTHFPLPPWNLWWGFPGFPSFIGPIASLPAASAEIQFDCSQLMYRVMIPTGHIDTLCLLVVFRHPRETSSLSGDGDEEALNGYEPSQIKLVIGTGRITRPAPDPPL